jgi:hypothetical protein
MEIVTKGFNAIKRSPSSTFEKLTVLSVNDLHSPTIRCPLNINGLLDK